MKPPDNTEIFETELATLWLDKDGILNQISKPVDRSLDRMKQSYNLIRQISNNNKVCLIGDISHSKPLDKEVRDYAAVEIPKLFKAIAVISTSPLGTMISNIFLKLKGQPVPMKLFTHEKEAKKWLKQYL